MQLHDLPMVSSVNTLIPSASSSLRVSLGNITGDVSIHSDLVLAKGFYTAVLLKVKFGIVIPCTFLWKFLLHTWNSLYAQ